MPFEISLLQILTVTAETSSAKIVFCFLLNCNPSKIYGIHCRHRFHSINTLKHCLHYVRPGRFYWSHEDPEIVADILFAIANVLSFARTTYVMPSHELLGPLQISLGRMLGDITRFVILFGLVSGFAITFITRNYR